MPRKKKQQIESDLSSSTWAWITFFNYTPIACPKWLVTDVIADIWDNVKLDSIEPLHAMSIDLPGPIVVNRKEYGVKIDSLELTMPYSDIESFCDQLAHSGPVKLSSGQICFKLIAFGKSIVLSPEQREKFLGVLLNVLPMARQERLEEMKRIAAAMSHVTTRK